MRRFSLICAIVLAAAPPLKAQGSPIVDLLLRARIALNDLRMAEADSLGMMVLSAFGERLNTDQRLEALSIMASARFPEPVEGVAQYPDSALTALRAMVRTDPGARLRSDVTWRGLDSLFAVARQTTFAVGARPPASNVLTGPRGEAPIEAFATRPARFALALVPAGGGTAVTMDSAGPTDRALLRLRGFVADRPIAAGPYIVVVHATDAESGDTLVLRFAADVETAPLDFVPVPRGLDSAQLRPEIAPRARTRGFVSGLLLAGLTVAGASAGMPSSLSSAGTGSALAAGVVLGAGAIIGGMLDRGRPLPENAAANLRVRSAFDESVRQARTENQRRVDTHQVSVTIHLGSN